MYLHCIFFAFIFRGITPLRITKIREYNAQSVSSRSFITAHFAGVLNVQRFNKNKKLFMMEIPENIENIENVENVENEFLVEMKKIQMVKHAGRDERYPDDKIDYEVLDKIRKNSIKMELLHDLQNSNISKFDKLLLLELNKDFFIEPDLTFNATAGGLLDDFYTLEYL
jgi:hypothetical protein